MDEPNGGGWHRGRPADARSPAPVWWAVAVFVAWLCACVYTQGLMYAQAAASV